jgi:hypothetical protein
VLGVCPVPLFLVWPCSEDQTGTSCRSGQKFRQTCNVTVRAIESCKSVICRRRVVQNVQDCNVVCCFVWVCQIV